MKFGPVTNLDKRNKAESKKFDDDIMSENCDVSAIFSIYVPVWSNPETRLRK